MLFNEQKPISIQVEHVDADLTYWIDKPYLAEETKLILRGVQIILLPDENPGKFNRPVFPKGTDALYAEFAKLESQGVTVGVAIEESEYLELELNSRFVNVGRILLMKAILPVALGVVGNFVFDRLKHEETSTRAKIEVIVVDGKHSTSIHYEGPASAFKDGLSRAVEKAIEADRK